jgi:hypothetical protein
MKHHTKTKGDLGVLKVAADLAEQDFLILHPLTEHASFDLVAYKNNKFLRIQVKYRTAVKGLLQISFSTVWSDTHGLHRQSINKNEVDIFAVFCPDTQECYYINPKDFNTSVALRISTPKNNQSKNVKLAADYKLLIC